MHHKKLQLRTVGKSTLFTFAVFLLIGSTANAFPAGVNLLTDGDFESATAFVHSDFDADTGPFNTWLTQPLQWVKEPNGGPAGAGDQYADHIQFGVRLFQGIAIGAGDLPIGSELHLAFDYIYQSGFTGISESAVHVFGMVSGDPDLRVQAPFNNPGVTLFSQALTPPLVDDWTSLSANFFVGADFDAVVVVFTANAFGANTSGLRGIDNVVLEQVDVPEPSCLLLFGMGLLGFGLRRNEWR